MNASAFRLVITTHGRVPKIARRSFTSCCPYTKDFSSSRRAGLWTLSFSRQSVLFPVGTEEDACPSPFLLCSLLFTADWGPYTLAFTTSSAVVSRFPESRVGRKLQDSLFEQDPFAFHRKHSPVFRLVKEFCPFPVITAIRSVISL